MCDPLTIAGVTLALGSTAANSVAQSKVANAREDSMAAERIRQRGLDREADAINTKSQDRYQDFGGQENAKAKELGDFFKSSGDTTAAGNAQAAKDQIMPASGSNIVVQDEAKQRGAAKDYADQQAGALGTLRSFGDLLGGISREQARDAGTIGQIGGFKRGSANVLPLELDAAGQKGGTFRTLGDILGGMSSVALGGASNGKTLGTMFNKADPAGVAPMLANPDFLRIY